VQPQSETSRADPFGDLTISSADCSTPSRATVTRADALVDVAVIERIVRRGWAGYEATLRAGVDVDARLAALKADVAAMPEPIAVQALQDRVVARLGGAADNHMAIYRYAEDGGWTHWRSLGRSERAYTADLVVRGDVVASGSVSDGARLLACRDHDLGDLLRPSVDGALAPVLRPIVLAAEVPPALHCRFALPGGRTVEHDLPMRRLRVASKKVDRDRGPAFELRSGPRPLLALHTLDAAQGKELEAFAATGEALRGASGLVLDLRGNSGGNDDYATAFFRNLTSGPLHYATIDRLDSDVTLQGDVNVMTCELARAGLEPAARARAEARLAEAKVAIAEARRDDRSLRVWRTRTPTDQGRAPRPFLAPLVVVVDGGCASSCESVLEYAHQIPSAILVGENSAGVGVFGEVRPYRLPRSGLGFSAGKKHFHDPDPGRIAPEGRGHLPDLWLDDDDPLRAADAIAACLATDGCALRKPR
jgi:hypothetical protein